MRALEALLVISDMATLLTLITPWLRRRQWTKWAPLAALAGATAQILLEGPAGKWFQPTSITASAVSIS